MYKKFIFIFFCFFVSQAWSAPVPEYEKIFSTEYIRALKEIVTHKSDWSKKIISLGGDPDLLIPVVFPELLRFNILQNRMETSMLRLFYVNVGESYANFSVGVFQMKPSFVESMEYAVLANSELKAYRFIADYSGSKKQKEIRKTRLERLENPDWQLSYLTVFQKIVDMRFSALKWNQISDKIRFYATAYNTGFNLSYDQLMDSMRRPCFPNGRTATGVQYLYSDISATFYMKYYLKIGK